MNIEENKMKLKKVLSNNAYWTVNKALAKEIGLDATILLQHFIDLQNDFFEDGGFYQQQKRLLKDLPLSLDYLRKATKVLVSQGFLIVEKRGIPAKNHYTVVEQNVMSFLLSTTSSVSEAPLGVSQKHDKHQELKETKNKITKLDETRSKLFFKLVDRYPKNRIGNRQHGIKKWMELNDEEMKLAITNVNRYLTLAGGYVKSLQNYISEQCYTEDWLSAQEKTKQTKTNKNTKTFNNNYDDVT